MACPDDGNLSPSSTQLRGVLRESVADACVDDGDELAHDGSEGDDFLFAVIEEAFVEGLEGGVVTAGGERGHEEDGSEFDASAADPAVAVALAALVWVGSDAGEGGAGLAVEGAEFGHESGQGGGDDGAAAFDAGDGLDADAQAVGLAGQAGDLVVEPGDRAVELLDDIRRARAADLCGP